VRSDGSRPSLCGVQGIRGLNQRLLVVDEAQYAPEALILQALIPILMMNESVAVFITTPDDPDSMFMRMIGQRDPGGNLRMPVLWLGMACERCEQEGNGNTCPHVWYESPAHKNPERRERLAWIYANHQDINARENLARPQARNRPSFPPDLVEDLFARPRVPHTGRQRCVFLAADPACGGENDFAVAAGYFDGDGFTVRRWRRRGWSRR
jgi:hypothetical protein